MNLLDILKPWFDAIIIFFVFVLIFAGFRKFFFKLITCVDRKLPIAISTDIAATLDTPARFCIVGVGLFFALKASPLSAVAHHEFTLHLIKSWLLISSFWALFNMTAVSNKLFMHILTGLGSNVSNSIVNIFSSFLHTVIVCVGAAMIISEWGYDINGFIAGLSLGGLALSLAAKDLLSDIFGGIVIIMDKPFVVGDWIVCNDVEGTVEKITFRSTKIRTFPQSLVYIPNAIIANTVISNFTTREKRRIDFTIGVSYETTREQMQRIVREIADAINKMGSIDCENTVVSFKAMNSTSLDIHVVCYSTLLDYKPYAQQLQQINLEILRILDEAGTSIAFPRTGIYWEKPVKCDQK